MGRRPQAGLENHRHWRPDWAPGRACLYWYLTLGAGATALLDRSGLEAVRGTDWLDAVPTTWLHVTLCDIGFTDEVSPADVERVVRAARCCAAMMCSRHLSLGPAACMEDTIALPVGPLEPLRQLQQGLRAATRTVLGPGTGPTHQHDFQPHLSLGYANRRVPAETAATVVGRFGPVPVDVPIDRLVLASVTRDRRYYRWAVLAELPLGPSAADG